MKKKQMLKGLTGAILCGAALWIMPSAQAAGLSPLEQELKVDAGGRLMSDLQQNQDVLMVPDDDIMVDIDATEFERPVLELPEELRLKVTTFRVSGQDVIPEARLLALLKGSENQMLTFGDLQGLAKKLTDEFRKEGYLTARVYLPAQKIINGQVEFTVVVGKYDGITFENNSRINDAQIRHQIAFLKPGEYVTRQKLERAVWLLTDLAGADAKATLTTGQGDGTVHLHLVIKPHIGKHGFLYTDNYGNRYTGYQEYGVQYDIVNLAHQGDHLAVNALSTGHRLTNGSMRYTLPALRDGLNFYVGYSQVAYDLGAEYRRMKGTGQARVYSAGMDYAIRRSEKNNLYTGLRFEHSLQSDAYRADALAAAGFDKYNDKIGNSVSLSLFGDELDRHGASSWRLEYKLGHYSARNEMTRYMDQDTGSLGWFSKVSGQYIRSQRLNHRSQLMLVGRGQFGSKNLDSYDHMSIGGISGVRAYPTSEGSGDCAYVLKAEHRWLLPLKSKRQTFQFATFYDFGHVLINRDGSRISDVNQRTMQGAGVGLIWQRPNEWFIRTDYAWRLGAEKVRSERPDHYANGHFWIQGGWYF